MKDLPSWELLDGPGGCTFRSACVCGREAWLGRRMRCEARGCAWGVWGLGVVFQLWPWKRCGACSLPEGVQRTCV
jgi:hypothetical protein